MNSQMAPLAIPFETSPSHPHPIALLLIIHYQTINVRGGCVNPLLQQFQNLKENEMQDTEKANSQIGLQEKNTLMQAWSDSKDSVFNVLFVILDKKSEDEEEESLGGLVFESGLDYLQIMAFPFNNLVLAAWNGGETLEVLISFFRKFNMSSYLPSAPFAAFLFILYALVFIILLILIDIIYVSYSFTKKKFKFTFPLVVLAQVVPLFVTVLFLPITETLLIVVQCQSVSGVWRMTSFPEVLCWQGWHLFHTSITLLFVTLFVIISSIVALALFEPRMTTKKLTARQNSNGEVVFIINKIVLQFFFSFSPFQGSGFYVTIIFLLAFWQFWCYNIKKPYYSKVATKFFRICSTYYFWTALMLMAGQLLQSYSFNGALIIWICGLPFFAIVIYFDQIFKGESLQFNNLKFKTGEELEEHISAVLELICNQKEDKVSGTLLIGYIERHKELCNEVDCPLKTSRKKRRRGKADSMEFLCNQLLKQVDLMFKAGLKKFPDCTKLRLSFAFFHLGQMQNRKKAFQEFSQTSQLEPSFDQQFNIYRFKKIIKENLEDRDESESDLVETIRFDNYVSLLEQAMILSAKLHKDFWTELKEEKPDLKNLNAIGSQITETGNAITENFREILKITSTSFQILYSYAHYLILVNEDYAEGKELLSNARKLFQDKQLENKDDQEHKYENESIDKRISPMIVVEYSPMGLSPRIINSNLLFTEISGFQRSELYEKELSVISPRLYADAGVKFLSFEGEQKEKEGFLCHKFRHLVQVSYEVVQKEENEWHVIFKIVTSNNSKMILLANPSGNITDYNLASLHLLRQFFSEDKQLKQNLNLTDLGIKAQSSKFLKKQNGSLVVLNVANQERECLAHVEPILASVCRDEERQQEESALMGVSEETVGWRVILAKYDRNSRMVEAEAEDSNSLTMGNESHFDDEVYELYENPNALDVLISQLAETRHMEEPHVKFELREKITTMRLLDNEIKMVYCQSNENDYEEMEAAEVSEDDREVFKFDDETYQAKLRTAINTNLNHKEVDNFRLVSLLFLLCLFGLCISQLYMEESSFSAIHSFLDQTNYRASQYSRLTSNIVATLNTTADYPALVADNQRHEVVFETQVTVPMLLENNFTESKNLKDAVILLNSRLVSFFQGPGSLESMLLVFNNYFNSIYPAFFHYPSILGDNSLQSFIFAGVTLAITCLMMAYWIFISLKIDKKRYDIMIWFLDIPIPYVSYLGSHCELYIKQFIPIKELGLKGIPLDEDEDDFEEFSAKKNNLNDNEEEIEEQIKTRKSLISKNKKETLLSKINLSALKVLWLLAYGLCFSCLVLFMTQQFYSDFKFLKGQWVQSANLIIVDNSLYLNLEVQNSNISVDANLTAILNQLRTKYEGGIQEEPHTENFNLGIFDSHLAGSAEVYDSVYFTNLCLTLSLSAAELAECERVVGGKLKSGYKVYSKYLITPESSMSREIAVANRKYTIPALLLMLETWNLQLGAEGRTTISLCTIMLYIFIIISTLSFLLFWLYYLRKLNTEINQTIQMLNMIPFKLLPKSRKETKMFIAWIIREANKTKHENE